MEKQKLVIIDYGAGNIQSIKFAIQRLGYSAILSNKINQIQEADKVIFPGVGEASSAMKMLRESGLDAIIPTLQQPVLGICLGMQLMCNFSEEGSTKGLDIFDVAVKRFGNQVKVPQIGWNQIENLKGPLFKNVNEKEYIYLVHSYYAAVSEDTIATSFYQTTYATALQKNNFFGTQFHPEKSSFTGANILKNFLELKN